MNMFLYVVDTMADWEIGYLTAEINSKRYFKDKNFKLEIVTVGMNKKVVKSMGGFSIQPMISIDEVKIEDHDLLVLPGSDMWMERETDTILNIAKDRIRNNKMVAAICGATFGLARIGALDDIHHTSNDKNFLKMICPKYKGENFYIDKPAIKDGNLVTASGIAPLEFTYEVIKLLNVFKDKTLENWINLFKTKESKYFFGLMDSLKE
jgi:putative intracellular protease/amidase